MNAEIAVGTAISAIARAERVAKRDKSSIPPFQMEKLVAEVKYCRAEVASAECSLHAAKRFPPCQS
jgi:hypothetical protein